MMATCNTHTEAKKIEPNPEMMQPVGEHQDVPREDTAVMSIRGLRKRRRVQKLTAERRLKPKEGTRGFCGSRRRVTVAGRRTSRHVTVACLKRKLFRRSGTQEHYGSQRLFAATSRGMALCAGVAQRGGHDDKRHSQVNVGQEIKKRQKDGKRMRKHPEWNRGLRDVGLSQQLQGRKQIKVLGIRLPLCLKNKRTTNGIKGWSAGQRSYLGKGGTLRMNLYEIFGGKIAKQVVGDSRMLQRIRKWTLWRGRPPPKLKTKLCT
jgi:hypothetical protein